jgi:hypothetical protein
MTRSELYQRVFHQLAGRLTCREVTEAVTEYLEGAMGMTRWTRFQLHLGLCIGCRIYLRQMRLTLEATKALPADPMPDAMRAELLRRFRSWHSA